MNFNLSGKAGSDSPIDSSIATPLKSKFPQSPVTSSATKATSDKEPNEHGPGSASKELVQSKFKQRGGGNLSRSGSTGGGGVENGGSGGSLVGRSTTPGGEGKDITEGEGKKTSGDSDTDSMPPPRSLIRPNPFFVQPSLSSSATSNSTLPITSEMSSTTSVFQKTSMLLEQKRQQKLEKKEKEKLHSKGEGRSLQLTTNGQEADDMELDELGPDSSFFQSSNSNPLGQHGTGYGRHSNDSSGLHHHRQDFNEGFDSNVTPPIFKVPGKRPKSNDGSKKGSKSRRKSSSSRNTRERSMASESEMCDTAAPEANRNNDNYDYHIDPLAPIPSLFPGPNPHIQHAQAQAVAHLESHEGEDLKKKWEGCTKEEWEQGGVELGKKFGDLLQRVIKLVQRKAERNAGLKSKMNTHKQELDQRREKIEETSANLKKWGNTI